MVKKSFEISAVRNVQRDKDIVYGYIKQIQTRLPYSDNPYYTIVKPIQDLCLLFFRTIIDSKILTDYEREKLLEMINNHRQIHSKHSIEYSLLYRATEDGFSRDNFYRKCDGKKDTLLIIQSNENNVFGAFTSLKWNQNGSNPNRHETDPSAFIYLIRSNQGSKSQLYPIKDDGHLAFYQHKLYLFIFGSGGSGLLVFGKGTCGYASATKCKEFNIEKNELNGDKNKFLIKDIELFQLLKDNNVCL